MGLKVSLPDEKCRLLVGCHQRCETFPARHGPGFGCQERSCYRYCSVELQPDLHGLSHSKNILAGNKKYISYVMKSNELTIVFTAPYSHKLDQTGSSEPHPGFTHDSIHNFIIGTSPVS